MATSILAPDVAISYPDSVRVEAVSPVVVGGGARRMRAAPCRDPLPCRRAWPMPVS